MVNKNYFWFDRKSLFNFWKMKTVNRFPNLNSSSLNACLWESTTAGHQSLLVARIYRRKSQILIFDCRNPASACRSDLVKMAGVRQDPAIDLAKMAGYGH
jgi:hypothetical protein